MNLSWIIYLQLWRCQAPGREPGSSEVRPLRSPAGRAWPERGPRPISSTLLWALKHISSKLSFSIWLWCWWQQALTSLQPRHNSTWQDAQTFFDICHKGCVIFRNTSHIYSKTKSIRRQEGANWFFPPLDWPRACSLVLVVAGLGSAKHNCRALQLQSVAAGPVWTVWMWILHYTTLHNITQHSL